MNTTARLSLKKDVVAGLSGEEQHNALGGEAKWTTSIGACSGFLCCDRRDESIAGLSCQDMPSLYAGLQEAAG